MKITAAELEMNLDKYLEAVKEEDILITEGDKTIAILSSPDNQIDILDSLVGIAKGDGNESLEQFKDMRLENQ